MFKTIENCTYAHDEYGKLLILQTSEPKNGKVQIKYWTKFRRHPEKFRIAIEKLMILSPRSIELSTAYFDKEYFDPKYFDTEKTIVEFETRTAIFYSDFKDNHIVTLPRVDQKALRIAYESFRQVIESIEI